jgi:hypothetical protein
VGQSNSEILMERFNVLNNTAKDLESQYPQSKLIPDKCGIALTLNQIYSILVEKRAPEIKKLCR